MSLQRTPAARQLLATLAWVGGLIVVLAGALALGHLPALAAPPLSDPMSLWSWAAGRSPVEAAFAVVRLAVVAMASYLLVVTVLAVVLRLGHAGRLVTAVDVVTLPWVRAVLHGALGVGLLGASLASVGAATGDGRRPVATSMTAADVGPATVRHALPAGGSDLLVRLPEAHSGAPTLRLLDVPAAAGVPGDDAPAPAPAVVEAPAEATVESATVSPGDVQVEVEAEVVPRGGAGDDSKPPALASDPGPAVVAAGEVTIAAGDHLWSVAARTLQGAVASPSEAAITAYWEQLVAANGDRLADPGNPDLVFPGQVLVLPAVPSP